MPPPLTTIFLLKSPSLPTDPYTTSFPPTLYSTPIHIPPLITTLHPTPLIALLSSPSSLLDYSAWIFTSQRAVRSLILAFEQHQKLKRVSDEWKREIREKYRIPLFAVGPGTAGALEREVIGGGGGGGGGGWMGACRVEGGGDAGRGEKLVPIIVSRCNMEDEDVLQREEWVGGKGKEKEKEKEVEVEGDEGEKTKKKKKKVLWLTGEKRREALRTGLEDAGIEVDCCIVYSTSLSPDFLPSFLQALCKQQQQQQQQQRLDEQQQQLPSERRRRDKKSSGNYDDDEEEEEGVRWVLVFSTQGSREILIALDWLDEKTGRVKRGFDEQGEERRTFVASIGGTTAGYLEEEFGFTVDVVAERPSPEGVREGIEAFMRRRGLLL